MSVYQKDGDGIQMIAAPRGEVFKLTHELRIHLAELSGLDRDHALITETELLIDHLSYARPENADLDALHKAAANLSDTIESTDWATLRQLPTLDNGLNMQVLRDQLRLLAERSRELKPPRGRPSTDMRNAILKAVGNALIRHRGIDDLYDLETLDEIEAFLAAVLEVAGSPLTVTDTRQGEQHQSQLRRFIKNHLTPLDK